MRKFAILTGFLTACVMHVNSAIAQFDFNEITGNTSPISVLGSETDPVKYIEGLSGFENNGALKIFLGLLFAMLLYYGIKLLVSSRNENAISEVKQAYGQAIMGAMIAGGAALLADTFAGKAGGKLVHAAPFNSVLAKGILFLKALLVTVVILNIVTQGIRLIAAVDDNIIDKAKKRLFHGLIGAAFVILASTIVDAFLGTSIKNPNPQAGALTREFVGMAEYGLTIFGALAVVGLIVSGIFLVVSVEESLKDRARKGIITCIVALVVVIASFGLVKVFAPQVGSPLPIT